MSRRDAVIGLDRVLWEWVTGGSEGGIAAWLERELDEGGGPKRLTLHAWLVCARLAAAARKRRGDWSADLDDRIVDLIDAAARFDRPGGGILTQQATLQDIQTDGLKLLGRGLTRLKAVRRGIHGGWASPTQVLACLRDLEGTALAFDHRHPGEPGRLELFLGGQSWLGPGWTVAGAQDAKARSRHRTWATQSRAELFEWRTPSPGFAATHTLALFDEIGLGLIAALVDTAGPGTEAGMRLGIPDGVKPSACPGSRAIQLAAGGKRPLVQLLPLGLPCRDYPTERGRFVAESGELVLAHGQPGKKTWLPLLVSWNPKRRGKPVNWRSLTITEKGKYVAPERASAARITWGRDETYLIYRSHAKPALRAVLGHCTTARFLFGRFKQDGAVEPILKLDD